MAEIPVSLANAFRELDLAVKVYLDWPTTDARESMSDAHDAVCAARDAEGP